MRTAACISLLAASCYGQTNWQETWATNAWPSTNQPHAGAIQASNAFFIAQNRVWALVNDYGAYLNTNVLEDGTLRRSDYDIIQLVKLALRDEIITNYVNHTLATAGAFPQAAFIGYGEPLDGTNRPYHWTTNTLFAEVGCPLDFCATNLTDPRRLNDNDRGFKWLPAIFSNLLWTMQDVTWCSNATSAAESEGDYEPDAIDFLFPDAVVEAAYDAMGDNPQPGDYLADWVDWYNWDTPIWVQFPEALKQMVSTYTPAAPPTFLAPYASLGIDNVIDLRQRAFFYYEGLDCVGDLWLVAGQTNQPGATLSTTNVLASSRVAVEVTVEPFTNVGRSVEFYTFVPHPWKQLNGGQQWAYWQSVAENQRRTNYSTNAFNFVTNCASFGLTNAVTIEHNGYPTLGYCLVEVEDPWDAIVPYAVGDKVYHLPNCFRSLQNGNLNHEPAVDADWEDWWEYTGCTYAPGPTNTWLYTAEVVDTDTVETNGTATGFAVIKWDGTNGFADLR